MIEPDMKRNRKNLLTIKISTYDADVEFDVKQKCTGQDVFNLACVTFGIRETWYFGLQFTDGHPAAAGSASWWLRPDRRLAEVVRRLPAGARLHFLFHVRFWVEDVAEDLLLEATVHLFFLEVKDLILTRQQWSATPELMLLLAAYVAQAELGDFDPAALRATDDAEGGNGSGSGGGCDLLARFLPARFSSQAQLEPKICEEKLRDHYRDLAGLGRAEAELEMLRLAQDLEMFGLVYFSIQNGGPTSPPGSWLAISCFGVSFFEQDALMKPYKRLGWSEIRHMSCRERKFTLVTNESMPSTSDEPTCFGGDQRSGRAIAFWTGSSADSKQILRLCVGNHELYMSRRMPDSIERQQMRATAREERAKRMLDKQRLMKEMEGRAAAERLRGAAEEKVGQLSQMLAKSEAMVSLLSERARLAEQEMRLLSEQKDHQVAHMRQIHAQLLSEKHSLADRARQFEALLVTLSEEASVNEAERDCLRQQLTYARQGEKALLVKLESLLRSVGVWGSAAAGDSGSDLLCGLLNPADRSGGAAGDSEGEETTGLNTQELLSRLETERLQFAEGSAAFEADLRQLRSRLQGMRMGAAALRHGGSGGTPVDPCVVTHSTAVSCPNSSLGSILGRLSNGAHGGPITYFEEL